MQRVARKIITEMHPYVFFRFAEKNLLYDLEVLVSVTQIVQLSHLKIHFILIQCLL